MSMEKRHEEFAHEMGVFKEEKRHFEMQATRVQQQGEVNNALMTRIRDDVGNLVRDRIPWSAFNALDRRVAHFEQKLAAFEGNAGHSSLGAQQQCALLSGQLQEVKTCTQGSLARLEAMLAKAAKEREEERLRLDQQFAELRAELAMAKGKEVEMKKTIAVQKKNS